MTYDDRSSVCLVSVTVLKNWSRKEDADSVGVSTTARGVGTLLPQDLNLPRPRPTPDGVGTLETEEGQVSRHMFLDHENEVFLSDECRRVDFRFHSLRTTGTVTTHPCLGPDRPKRRDRTQTGHPTPPTHPPRLETCPGRPPTPGRPARRVALCHSTPGGQDEPETGGGTREDEGVSTNEAHGTPTRPSRLYTWTGPGPLVVEDGDPREVQPRSLSPYDQPRPSCRLRQVGTRERVGHTIGCLYQRRVTSRWPSWTSPTNTRTWFITV